MKSKKSSLNSPGKKQSRRESNPSSVFIEIDERKIKADRCDQLIELIKCGKTEERPPCPKCGKGNPVSNGLRWRCRACGKQYNKIRVIRDSLPQGRSPCPLCKSGRVWSHSMSWVCADCGRQWVKHPRGKK